jgi:hypothetical protein
MRTTSQRRRWWLPAVLAGAAAAVVGLACGALIFGDDPPQAPTSPASPPGQPAGTAPPPSISQPAASPTGTAGQAGDPVPGDLAFTEVAGLRLPVSDTAGPSEVAAGLARGFTRTQAGAALAAAHVLVRVHPEVGADVFGPTLDHQVVGDAGDVQALAGNVADAYEQLLQQWPATYGQPAGRLYLAIGGYRIDSFTDTDATVALLIEVPDNGGGSLLGATTVRMRWHQGDWALVAPAGGAFTETSVVEDTSGFALWGP